MVAYERARRGEVHINECIKRDVLLHRTIEAIKWKRRQWLYQDQLHAEGRDDAVVSDTASPPLPSLPPPEVRKPGLRPRPFTV